MNVKNQYKQNIYIYIFKNVRGKNDFVLFSAQVNRGTPQMLCFSETADRKKS